MAAKESEIWLETRRLLGRWTPAADAAPGTAGAAGGTPRCGATRADTPICRVQQRLVEPAMLERATSLAVQDRGDRWAYTIACVAATSAGLLQLRRVFVRALLERAPGVSQLLGVTQLAVCAWAAFVSYVLSRSRYTVFEFKQFVPVPQQPGGALGWGYYLKTDLPDADLIDLAYEGGGPNAAAAVRAAAPFQGGLSLAQVRIKTSDAIHTLLDALRPKGDDHDSAEEDLARVRAACDAATAAAAGLKDGLRVARANGLTAAALAGLQAADAAPARAKDLARRLVEAAGPRLEAGLPGAPPPEHEDAWLHQAAAALEVATPRVLEALARRAAAVKLMASLDDRLAAAAQRAGVDEGHACHHVLLDALTAVPRPEDGLQAIKSAKALTAAELVRADAALSVASASMDATVLRAERGGGRRMELVVMATVALVASLSVMWLLFFAARLLLAQGFSWSGRDAREVRVALGDLGDGMGGVVRGLSAALRFAVVLSVGAAFVYNRRLAGIVAEVSLKAKEAMLERAGAALRAMVKAGGVRALLTAGERQHDFLLALRDLDAVMAFDLLSDGAASASRPPRISDLIVFGTALLACALALFVLTLKLRPLKALSYMRELATEPAAMKGGGALLPELTAADRRYFSGIAGSGGLPDSVRALVMLMALVSLSYYFLRMVSAEAAAKDTYYDELTAAAKERNVRPAPPPATERDGRPAPPPAAEGHA